MTLSELTSTVVKGLEEDYGFLADDARVAVTKSQDEDPDLWHDDADAYDLMEYLADPDKDE